MPTNQSRVHERVYFLRLTSGAAETIEAMKIKLESRKKKVIIVHTSGKIKKIPEKKGIPARYQCNKIELKSTYLTTHIQYRCHITAILHCSASDAKSTDVSNSKDCKVHVLSPWDCIQCVCVLLELFHGQLGTCGADFLLITHQCERQNENLLYSDRSYQGVIK